MAYATLSDVKARAGVLAKAWGQATQPGDADIERYADQVAAEIDAYVGSTGAAVPVTDPVAAGALVGVNADKALLLALDATWPGGEGDVAALRGEIAGRVQAYDDAIANNKLAALLFLSSEATLAGGASNFWTSDADPYLWWEAFADRLSGWGTSYGILDPWGVPRQAGPNFAKGMRL